ncbi:MAG: type II toxin-antitoxin system RelE/ParE family toxin [Candidatus Woesearchaeota archaeon]|jgi:mRNA-degrading endonuclease RelE of RelBE toxin-antitoxin system|nr:type II toxin-antitoxin system RelE/ParE family toxin [Candidatus Woesearchaeota archaeon]|tara:strand:+ start:601 stop:918 length:318 start_codon:yes stop_codon:yes gene_type:complete
MAEYELIETTDFEKSFNKLPIQIKERFKIQFNNLKDDPYSQGKPLGYKRFRELKNDAYRVYYLVYDNEIIVLFVGVSDKKDQQEVIDVVKNNIEVFKNFIENRNY